jgi:NAD(P)-dependent dehydrogenase (short-subunit alcohol dehydrogenase family)
MHAESLHYKEVSMDLQLNGKKAVVTGSTAGIGLAIAISLAKEGAAVVVNGRTAERVTDAVKAVRTTGGSGDVTGIAADLGTADGVKEFLRQVESADILVNNLGIFEPKPFAEISDAEWMKFFEVNVLSGVRLARHYLPRMLAANWGRIVFISSESALLVPAEMIHYGVTKSAQISVARGLAELTAGSGVTVNSVLPGPTRSEGVETFVEQLSKGKSFGEFQKEFFQSVRPSSLLKRFETVEEIAAVVTFVCSPLASAINGAPVRAEGGVVKSAF